MGFFANCKTDFSKNLEEAAHESKDDASKAECNAKKEKTEKNPDFEEPPEMA